MHAVQHLADCVLDYGPAHGWTCFAFERMKGMLKETSTNTRNVEETLIRVWTQRDYLQILPHLNGRWAKMTQSVRGLVLKMLGCQMAAPVCDLSVEQKAARELRLNVGAQFACVMLEHLQRRQPGGDGRGSQWGPCHRSRRGRARQWWRRRRRSWGQPSPPWSAGLTAQPRCAT